MRIGLILVGDELLSGKRQDKHLPWLINALDQRRLELNWVRMIGDEEAPLAELLKQTMATGDLVFSCGGIGATPDDRTRQAAAAAAGVPLVLHPGAKQLLLDRYGDATYPQRIHMAELPEGAALIPNPVNQIAGFSLGHHHFVPGFPNMAHPMMEWVLDTHYAELSPGEAAVEYGLKVHKVPESELVELMEVLLAEHPGLRLSSLPDSKSRSFIELSVRGPQPLAAAAYQKMLVSMQARQMEMTDFRAPDQG
jgi:molybdopterin-biosynthesis enzyme MoeA-like protein